MSKQDDGSSVGDETGVNEVAVGGAGGAASSGARRKLGRGLGALMREVRHEEPVIRLDARRGGGSSAESGRGGADARSRSAGLLSLAVAVIEPHPDQPRRRFDEAALAELASSIAARGLIQPVIVRPLAGGRFQLVAGERRWRAAQMAQVHEIPALVRELADHEVTALALIENLQREDLNPVEEARAYRRLSEEDGMTQEQIAKLVDKSRSHVANLQRLLALPDRVLDHVEEGKLDMGHARALIGVADAQELAERAIAKGLSVRDVERLARRSGQQQAGDGERAGDERRAAGTAQDDDIAEIERQLEDFLGLTVRIAADAGKGSGTVTVRYRTLDHLDLICQRLTGRDI